MADNLSVLSDAELISQVQAAQRKLLNQQALTPSEEWIRREFVTRYNSYIFGIVWHCANSGLLPPHEVDDVVQDVWVRIFNGILTYDEEGKIHAWLGRLTGNIIRDHKRRTKPQPLSEDLTEGLHSKIGLPRQIVEGQDFEREVYARLDPTNQAILRLELAGYSRAEIADRLGLAVNAVDKRWSRFTKQLRQDLSDLAME